PAVFESTGSLIFAAGSRTSAFAALRAGGAVLVPDPIAARDGVKVGDLLQLGLPSQRTTPFKVAGVVAYSIPSASGQGDLLISLAAAKTHFGRDEASLWALVPKPGIDAGAFRAAVAESAKALAATPISASDLAGDLARSLDRLIGLFDALALITVFIAALGIVNTLSVGVVERLREIAILRANGMTIRQVQAMVVSGAAMMGVVGGLAAVGTGLLVAWALGGLRPGAASGGPGRSWGL